MAEDKQIGIETVERSSDVKNKESDDMPNNYTIWERMVDKVMSGRFVMTIITSLVFAYMACNGMISEQFASNVIVMVTTFYFSKQQNQPQGSK